MNQNFRLNLFRIISIVYLSYGFNYLYWRHQESLNEDALIFSYALFLAEALMIFGSILMIINHWDIKKIKLRKSPFLLSQIKSIPKEEDRHIKVDVYIATYNEPLKIVEETVKSAVKLQNYSKKVVLNICLCDDGKRDGTDASKENFKALALKYNINYYTRPTNYGFKAGNLNNVFWQTDGDFIVILDADTIVYPHFIKNLLSYFKEEKMAWVQSPQHFYDIPRGVDLIDKLGKTSVFSKVLFSLFPFLKRVKIGKDIFGTDPTIFYQVILYHRNASNAAFCCGAGSIHRREALESLIIDSQNDFRNLNSIVEIEEPKIVKKELYEKVGNRCIGPFVHHISEDLYTSILMHSSPKKWKSYQHPVPECKMLSPQSLPAYDKQFSRYAEGSFSIFFSKNNPIIRKGLSVRQRLAYAETLYSYFSAFWILIFLLSPIIFYFTLIPPLKAFSFDFFLRFIILNVLSQTLILLLYWGIPTNRSDQYFMSGFWLKIRAFFKVLLGKDLKFNTTKKGKDQTSLNQSIKLVFPHLVIVGFILIGLLYNIYLIFFDFHPSLSAFWANNIWAAYNVYQLSPILRAAFKKNES
jgi:cellulose synthase (UDP-forming)